MLKIPHNTSRRLCALLAAILPFSVLALQAQVPTDNPVATHYGPGNYPLWTQGIRWDNVINMAEYTNGANDFERFENARDALYAQGGGVLYYPAGEYFFDLPDVGWGAGNGTTSRGLMLKTGVVIRGADLVSGGNQAVIRQSQEVDSDDFARVSYNLQPQTVFRFPFHRRGTDPVTGEVNSAGYVPSHWSFVGITPSANEQTVADVHNVGIVNVKLDGGFVFWGFHTPRAETMSQGRWLQNFKDNWPADAPFEQTWAGRAPDGTHYMDAINGGENWHTPVSAGSGRLIFGVYSVDGAPFDDMTRMDVNTRDFGFATQLPADAFHSYRFTGRFTAHGSDIFIANNVLAKPTRNFVHRMLQNVGGTNVAERNVLFDFSNHIGVDVNKSNFGGRQRDPSVTGFDTGYHFPNVIVRDNWIFNRGNKGMDIAGQYLVLYNNHNERYHIAGRFPLNYITNPGVYIAAGATEATGINAGGVSFDGWRWQSSTSASDFMSRGYDIGGRNVWAHRNSVINTGSIGNDGEGIMAQYHNHVAVLSWAFTENHQNQFDLGPGTFGEPGWIGVYDMHTIGYFHWRNFGPGQSGYLLAAHRPDALNVMLDAFIGPNLGTGSRSAPVTRTVGGVQVEALRYTDYQTLHTDPVNAPTNVFGTPLPNGQGIVLTWEDASDNELGFRVERRFPGTEWQVMAYRPPVNGTRIHGINDVFYQETNPAAGYSGPVVAIPFDYPEVNPTRWTDFTARPDMGPEYRVVAINGLDDDSTGVSDIFFADPDSLKIEVSGLVAGVIGFTDLANGNLSVTTRDGDGTPVSVQWSALSGPGTVTFGDSTAAATTVSFSVPGVYLLRVQASDESYNPALQFTVNAGLPVVFTQQPTGQSLLVGSSVTLSAAATGSEPISYQWLRNGVIIPDATSPTFTIDSLELADAGTYQVRVTNPLGPVDSAPAVLTVETAPVLQTLQPRRAAAGTAVTFSIDYTAVPAPTYQWFFNGEPLVGQTGPTLTVSPVFDRVVGDYSVQLTNVHGTATSNFAALEVLERDRFLINFSRAEFTSDGTNAWQTVALNTGAQNSTPNVFSNLTLRNFNDDTSAGITMSQSSTVTGNNVGFLTDITPALFTGNVPEWFDTSLEPLRQSFGFNSFNNWFEFTFAGFDAEDEVTFEFVMARAGTGERPISLILNPGAADQQVLLSSVSTNLTPRYPSVTVSGAESYTFRITNDRNNTWAGLLNAMAIDVAYAFEEPTAPEVAIASSTVRAEPGTSAVLNVAVSGVGPFSFQWFRNGEMIPGATSATLQLEAVTSTAAGSYTVAVTNVMGTVISDPIELRVVNLERVDAFLETFDAGTVDEPLQVTLSDIGWNVHHSFGGHSLVGRDIGLMESDGTVSEWIFDPANITEAGDFRFGTPLGFVSIFVDDRPNYGGPGTRQGASWPAADQPGPHPDTNTAVNNRILSLLLWTEQDVNIDGDLRASLEEFSFVQGFRDAGSHSFMPAVRIGDEWFVYHVSQEYLRDNVRPRQILAGQNPASAAEFNAETVFRNDEFISEDYETETRAFRSQLYRFAWSERGWTRLVFDGEPGTDSSVGMTLGEVLEGDLPADAINAIGVFTPENLSAAPFGGFRVDSIRLVAAVEPPPFTSLFTFTFNNETEDRRIQTLNWGGKWGAGANALISGPEVLAEVSVGNTVNAIADPTPGGYRSGFLFVAGQNGTVPGAFLVSTDHFTVVNEPQLPQGGTVSVNPQTDWFSETPFTDDLGTVPFGRIVEMGLRTQPVRWAEVAVHLALELDGQWYISATGFVNESSAWTFHTLDVQASDWLTDVAGEDFLRTDLPVNPGTWVFAADMPKDALITGIGFYVYTGSLAGSGTGGGNQTWTRIDSITLLAEAPAGFAPPVILTQPSGIVALAGDDIELTVVAGESSTEISYQWFKDGQAITGATSATLSISNATPTDSGSYTVAVSNAAGSVTSRAAVVEVLAMPVVTPLALDVPAEGAAVSVDLIADNRVSWTVASLVNFITVAPTSAEGSGSATIMFNVSPNSSVDERVGTVNVGGTLVTVTQMGMAVSVDIEPGVLAFDADGGISEFLVFATPGYTFSATADVGWITVVGGPSFTGDSLVEFVIAANPQGVNRSAVLTIDEETFTITQTGRVVDFFPGAEPANPELPGAVIIDWLGWAYTIVEEGFVWTWTENHGWWGMFPAEDVGDSIAYFLWDADSTDWWYVVADAYPWLYAFNVNGAESHGWLYFFEHTSQPRWFFSVQLQDFVTDAVLYPHSED